MRRIGEPPHFGFNVPEFALKGGTEQRVINQVVVDSKQPAFQMDAETIKAAE